MDDQSSSGSTQSMTRTSQNTYQARFHEIDAMIRKRQKALDASGKVSSDRLSTIERQLHRFDDMDSKIGAVRDQITEGLWKTGANGNHGAENAKGYKFEIHGDESNHDQLDGKPAIDVKDTT